MALPKINHPLFPITVPSLAKEFMFRPFLVSEEKILLMAQASGEDNDILRAIKQIVTNCVQGDLKVGALTEFDLQYIFLKLRAISVSNEVKVIYTDPADQSEAQITVNLDDVVLEMPKDLNNIVWIDKDEGFGMKLKFPSADETIAFKDPNLDPDDSLIMILTACIEEVFNSEDIYQFSDNKVEERVAFVNDLPVPAFNDMQVYFDKMPELTHEVKYKLKGDKEERKLVLSGLNDFFSWG